MAAEANTSTLSTNLNVDPYYDDFNETKNFHRILFRPGLAVQARELTQMQSIMQNQIDRFAEHIFKEGSIVRGCEVNTDNNYQYVKLRNSSSIGTTVNAAAFLNKIVKGTTSGVLATVVNTSDGSEAAGIANGNYKTLFVKYISANTSTGYRYFANNEILNGVGAAAAGLSANTISSAATGGGYAVTINSGIVYARDHFIRVPEQTVVVSKYSTSPSAKIGYTITEEIISEISDETLLDPASGSYNYAAPGAARLKLTPILTKRELSDGTANNFVELLSVQRGQIISSSATKTQYAAIRDYLAQRTADESGDYVVSGFLGTPREHLNSGNNYGVYTSAEGGDVNKLVIEFSPGKAYVKGYDIEKIVSTRVDIDKGLDIRSIDNAKTFVDYGNYVIVDNVVGEWDLEGQAKVSLRTTQADAVSTKDYSSTVFPGTEIGTARVRGIEYYTGIPGSPSAKYKLYLTDIRMTTASFANVQSIGYSGGTAKGKADISGSNGKNANTSDPSFDIALFRLPSRATKRLTDSSGNVDNDFAIFRVYSTTSFTTGAAAQITSADASETFDGTVGVALSDDVARAKFLVVVRSAANTAPANGTVSMSGNTITGSSTAFDTQFNVGDIVNIGSAPGSADFIVNEITGAGTMKVLGAGATIAGPASIFKKFKPGQVLDMGGYGKRGSRTITLASSTVVDFDLKEPLRQSLPVTIIAEQNKSDATVASKAIQRNRVVQIRVGAGGGTSYTANTTGPWPLGVSDGFRLVKVRKLNGSNFTANTEGTDVTSHFYLDNGQRDSFYDHVRLVKKPTSTLSVVSGDRMLVTFDYFTHSYPGSVNLFTVGSYPVNDSAPLGANIALSQIPIYVSPSTGTPYDLRDCIDFRPRVTDTANSVSHSGTISNASINPLIANTFVTSMSGGLHFSPPGEDFTTDLEYYLPRRDLIAMDKSGSIRSIRGVPDSFPRTPSSGAEYMNLASVYIPPYPSLSTQTARAANRFDYAVKYSPVKNDRYTMRDIGIIRDRVEKLEYYTSLSLLEKHSADLIVRDASGNDRFKNGILVDGFKGHNIGNVYDYDYSISVDRMKNELRPRFSSDSIDLVYKATDSTNVVRTNVTTAGVSKDQILLISNSQINFANGATLNSGQAKLTYKVDNKLYIENATTTFSPAGSITDGTNTATISAVKTVAPGALITLPYSHEVLVRQPYATTTRNLTGSAYNWIGNLTLNPEHDFWTDTTRRPDVNVNFENLFDNLVEAVAPFVNQTEWNQWQTVGTGVPYDVGDARLVGSSSSGGIVNSDNVSVFTDTNTFEQTTNRIDNQSRSGVQTSLVLGDARQQTTGDIIRDINIQDKMRSRQIKFRATGIKPSSTYYAFFDDVNVSSYITPTTSAYANTGNEGAALRSYANGVVYGIFRLPSSDTLSFTTGTKMFRLTDNPTNSRSLGAVTSSAETNYTSQGLNAGVSETIISTRAPVLKSETVTGTRDITVTGTRRYDVEVTRFEPNPDPLAQTFLTNAGYSAKINSSSMFLTKLDIFIATKDDVQPLLVEIREVDPVNSTITNRVVPFSQVQLLPSEINTSTNGSKPTQVIFSSPLHLTNGIEYAIVLKPAGGSPNYTAFIAELGRTDIITGSSVNSQPASGMLFTSANERAWTPNEREDLKFTAYYAKFDTSTSGSVVMKNADVDYLVVENTTGTFGVAGETIHGETRLVGTFANTKSVNTGVTYVRGLTSGATGTISSYSTSVVTVRDVSTNAKFVAGEIVNVKNTSVSGLNIGNCASLTSATTPIGKMYQYDVVNYADTKMVVANVSYTYSGSACTSSRMFAPNTYIKGQTTGYSARIVSIENKPVDLIDLVADYITPSNTTILATSKFATATNAVDSTYFGVNINDNTDLSATRYIISRSNEGNTSATSSTMNSSRSAQIRFTITSNNIVASPVVDVGRTSIVAVHNLINSNSEITTSEDYVTSGGNAKSRYISRRVTLADGQDAEDLIVYLTAYKPSTSQINVYYKILHAEDSDTFGQARWIPMTISDSGVYSSSENKNDFIEFQFTPPTFAATTALPYAYGANTTNSSILEYRNSSKARFVGFKQFAVKIVLTNSVSTNPPRVKDLRVIALQR